MTFNLETLIHQLRTAIVVVDASTHIVEANLAFSSLAGVSTSRALGKPFSSIFSFSTLSVISLQEQLHERSTVRDSDVHFICRDGRTITVELTASEIAEDMILLEMQPIDSQRKLTMDNLHEHQHIASRELIRGLAHEIKNPLGGIRGAAQLLEDPCTDEEHQAYTQIIINQVDRLKSLVDRLLGPSQKLQKRVQNIHEAIETVIRLIQVEAEGVTIMKDYDPSIPEFSFDADLLFQTILNIAQNAVEAFEDETQESASLSFKTRIEHQLVLLGVKHRLVVVISITDNGPGVPSDLMDTVFYPMVSGKDKGSGLGLSIAQTLVNQHGGRIDCESCPGHTMFSIYLPLLEENE
ncbi:nitrogen regulation protein NR(II) [Algicola sagamiensis]|uniref:nitrogen regulation protein NR(II) n=1 Tax=Algicola sagamiensis TaxID=163869 RepID=UPI00037BA725|nr:nitrogen regulation protein NR(II) [Algicola sagamiensis]